MTNKQMEDIAMGAMGAMSKKVGQEYKDKTIPHPANVNAIDAFNKKWGKQLDDKLALIERRRRTGYYDKNPDDYKKDYEDAYYARFILRIGDKGWKNYLK